MILVSPVGSLGSQPLSLVLSSHHGLRGGNGNTIMLHRIWFSAIRVVAVKTGKMKLGGNMRDSIFLSGGFRS